MSRPGAVGRRSTKGEYIETVGIKAGFRCTELHTSSVVVVLRRIPRRAAVVSHIHWPFLTTEQDSGNKISRRAVIEGKQNIMLSGKSVIMAGVCLRGDLFRRPEKPAEGEKEGVTTAISIGRSVKLHNEVGLIH